MEECQRAAARRSVRRGSGEHLPRGAGARGLERRGRRGGAGAAVPAAPVRVPAVAVLPRARCGRAARSPEGWLFLRGSGSPAAAVGFMRPWQDRVRSSGGLHVKRTASPRAKWTASFQALPWLLELLAAPGAPVPG